MNELKLIEQDVKNNPIYSQKWIVKNGKKHFANIYKRDVKNYAIEINSIQWQKTSLIECIDQANEMAGLMFFNRVIFCRIKS